MYLRLCFGLIFLMASGTCLSQIYKWVDEDGKVHYGDKKISGVEQNVIDLEVTKSDWTRFDIKIETRDVDLSEKEREGIIDGVNTVYEFYDRVLYFDMYTTVPVNILLLKNRSEYVNYLNKKNQSHVASSYGVYFSKENQIVVYIQENRGLTFKTIMHEVSHAIVDTIVPYSPAWLNEGLAEQMETLSRSESGLYLTPHLGNRRSVERRLKNGGLANMEKFLKLPSSQWRHSQTGGQGSLQSQAGQFVYFLLSNGPSRSFVGRLMHKFERGDRTLSYYLVDENYIGGTKSLEIRWKNWLKKQSTETIEFF